ncbi:MAG: ATP-binding cassette domain-containing protein, partial [Paramuribaculum sp.]|nr:ATP-binding cassette domain-containing protein [Paramuribaculum sp.]
MDSLLQVKDLTKSVGDRMLFADVTFGVFEGDKIGIIAKNGTGKTTLLNILVGREAPDSGEVVACSGLRIAYLEQSPRFPEGESTTVLEACLANVGEGAAVIAAYEQAVASGDPDAIARASSAMDAAEAWDLEDRMRQLLSQLSITDLNFPIARMSGGQQKRVALAAAILSDPRLLILDEPTNHLDIPIVEWLEQYLS